MRPSSNTGTAAAKVSTETEQAQTSCRRSSWPRTIAHGSSTQRGDREHPEAVALDPEAMQVGCSDASATARPVRADERQPGTGGRGPRQHHRAERPAQQRERREAEHRDVQPPTWWCSVGAEPRAPRCRGRAVRRPAERRGVRAGTQSPSETARSVVPSDGEERLVGRRTQPAGVLGAEHVQHDQPQRDRGERLGSDAEVAAGQPLAGDRGRDGEPDQHRGAAADAEPRPGHGQEDHGGDEQAGRAEPEQDLGDRGGAEAGGRRRRGEARARGTGAAYERTGGGGGAAGGAGWSRT